MTAPPGGTSRGTHGREREPASQRRAVRCKKHVGIAPAIQIVNFLTLPPAGLAK